MDTILTIDERLKKHPDLRERFEAILNIAESRVEGPDTADAVEERTIVEVRKIGQEVMKDWAENKADREKTSYKESHPQARPHKKK